jgi:hypothetical protein
VFFQNAFQYQHLKAFSRCLEYFFKALCTRPSNIDGVIRNASKTKVSKTFYQYQISTLTIRAHINIACIQTLQTLSFHLQISSSKCPASAAHHRAAPRHCTMPPRRRLSPGHCAAESLHTAAPLSLHTTCNRMQQTTCCSTCTVN